MLRSLVGLAFAGAVLAAPAYAQTRETEFGVDVSIRWLKPSSGDGRIEAQTPVDLRVAFHNGAFAIEPRITAQYLTSHGDNYYAIRPGVNLLIALPGSTHQDGAYSTLGGDMTFAGGTGMTTASAFSFNGGFGMRRPMGKAAVRMEFFVGYTPSQKYSAQDFSLGARLGFSFFN